MDNLKEETQEITAREAVDALKALGCPIKESESLHVICDRKRKEACVAKNELFTKVAKAPDKATRREYKAFLKML